MQVDRMMSCRWEANSIVKHKHSSLHLHFPSTAANWGHRVLQITNDWRSSDNHHFLSYLRSVTQGRVTWWPNSNGRRWHGEHTTMHHGKKNVLLGNLGSCPSCGSFFDTYARPKHCPFALRKQSVFFFWSISVQPFFELSSYVVTSGPAACY